LLVYIIAKTSRIFLFWGTDLYENRAHVHVGKRGTEELCKIWLEPTITMETGGSLTTKQQVQVLEIATSYREELLRQWKHFKTGQKIRMITIKK
jgi:hypothetical protein